MLGRNPTPQMHTYPPNIIEQPKHVNDAGGVLGVTSGWGEVVQLDRLRHGDRHCGLVNKGHAATTGTCFTH
jgi:hypothetical protein